MDELPTTDENDLEETIKHMEADSLCVQLPHNHSFQSLNFMHPFRKCDHCQQRLQTVVFNSNQVIKCVACGTIVHRSCSQYARPCTVNTAKLYEEDPPPSCEAKHPFASISRALQENIMAHFRIESTYDLLEDDKPTTTSTSSSRTPWVLAGGIAGGIAAGMVLAGPAGAYAGYQVGRFAAGALGIILEGSVSVGVVVAGVATGVNTANRIQNKIEERILTMGEEGTTRKVLMVRPNIHTDPIWETFCQEAIAKAPKSNPIQSLLNTGDQRYQREHDITATDENEIPTNDKVTLLVYRIMNDKSSLPGFVYRYLIQKFHDRQKERETIINAEDSSIIASPRARRDDTHAIIKHTTTTLLKVRPNLGSSSTLTELTATAVEGLVFGELYDLVMEEIKDETRQKDESLLQKINDFEKDGWVFEEESVAEVAIDALHSIADGHSAAEKLGFCVLFLEKISDYFSTKGINADSLLKMVCQHIVHAKVKDINAEVAFLEEFARDEQLLRGREGYALVTLQASLHFLNTCTDLEKDIFEQDDEEENVPIDS